MPDPVMKTLGQLNERWGVCGFTSTFHAMYHANPATRGWLVNATEVYSVLYEISDYLKALQAAASPLLKDITNFTRSFGPPYDSFTVDSYIHRIDNASEATQKRLEFGEGKKNEGELQRQKLFGIALPPQAVADYIERMWKWKATITEFGAGGSTGAAIVGVRNVTNTTMTKYHGLCHYLYRDDSNKYYSWGKVYTSLAAAKKDYAICYAITIRKY